MRPLLLPASHPAHDAEGDKRDSRDGGATDPWKHRAVLRTGLGPDRRNSDRVEQIGRAVEGRRFARRVHRAVENHLGQSDGTVIAYPVAVGGVGPASGLVDVREGEGAGVGRLAAVTTSDIATEIVSVTRTARIIRVVTTLNLSLAR